MSTETAKENASIVDSSVSQKPDAGIWEETANAAWKVEQLKKMEGVLLAKKIHYENSSSRANVDKGPFTTEEEVQKDLKDNSTVIRKDKLCNTRYFIIKSLNHDNIQLSVEKGIWATQVMNEPILEEAFHNSGEVILIFSVNSSGFFQGYAQMMSSVGQRRDNVWTQGTGPNNPWGRTFKVKWLRLSDLPFHKTLHLKNPLNEYKPVKISRDCQELSPEIGESLCQLIDREYEEDPSLKRDIYLVGRPDVDSGYCFPDEGYIAPPVDMTWATKGMVYPSYLYQYHNEASGSLLAHHGSAGIFPPESMANKGSMIRHAHSKGSTLDTPADGIISSQVDRQQMSSEMSTLCSNLSEDDFLEMSYEEYLEAHSRGIKQDGRKSQRKEYSSSKEHDDDDLHSSKSERGSSRKRSRR